MENQDEFKKRYPRAYHSEDNDYPKSEFRETPLTKETLEEKYARVYDDDYLDKQFEEHYPYPPEFHEELHELIKKL